MTERFRITDRVYVNKVKESYHVFYSNRPVEQHFKPVITLNKDEYGRLVYNERAVTFDSEWVFTDGARVAVSDMYSLVLIIEELDRG